MALNRSNMKQFYLILLLLYLSPSLLAQEQHLILFKDKITTAAPETFLSAKALARRTMQNISINERDYPVNPTYLDAINATGAQVIYSSKWLNGALVQGSADQITAVKALTFLRESVNFNDLYGGTRINEVEEVTALDYGDAEVQVDMLGANDMHDLGYNGTGISIAVFDSGFPGVNTVVQFDSLRTNNQIKETYDFVNQEENVYNNSDNHGTRVLSIMAAYQASQLIGTAFKADYYLYVTENVASEFPVEEFNWLVAAERADSIGVDIINSSLGYIDFDRTNYNYTQSDLTGDRSIISQAADFAAATGMLIVTSAGNSGSSSWGKISMPADADSILAVGSVNGFEQVASHSSRGPSADGRIKPDVMALGVQTVQTYPDGFNRKRDGTSFAAPLIAGFAACVWQQYPSLNNMELLEMIRDSGSNAATPNNDYGYGIPNYSRIGGLVPLESSHTTTTLIHVVPNPSQQGLLNFQFDTKLVGKPCDIIVYTATGAIVHQESITIGDLRHQIKLNPNKKQLYLVVANYGDHQEVIRVLSE